MNKSTEVVKNIDMSDLAEARDYFDYADEHIAVLSGIPLVMSHKKYRSHFLSILFCKRGRATMMVDNEEVLLQTCDVLLLNSNVVSSLEQSSDDALFDLICFSPFLVKTLLLNTINLWHIKRKAIVRMSENMNERLASIYGLIIANIRDGNMPLRREIILTLSRALLLSLVSSFQSLANSHEEGDNGSQRLFNRFLNTLTEQKGKYLSVRQYASLLGISAKHLSEVCRDCSEDTPKKWIAKFVVSNVFFLLRTSNMTVGAISKELGFKSISHFGVFIKRNVGLSPAKLRDKLKHL